MREKEILCKIKDGWSPTAPFFVKLISSFQVSSGFSQGRIQFHSSLSLSSGSPPSRWAQNSAKEGWSPTAPFFVKLISSFQVSSELSQGRLELHSSLLYQADLLLPGKLRALLRKAGVPKLSFLVKLFSSFQVSSELCQGRLEFQSPLSLSSCSPPSKWAHNSAKEGWSCKALFLCQAVLLLPGELRTLPRKDGVPKPSFFVKLFSSF